MQGPSARHHRWGMAWNLTHCEGESPCTPVASRYYHAHPRGRGGRLPFEESNQGLTQMMATRIPVMLLVATTLSATGGCQSPGKPGDSSRSQLHREVQQTIATFRSREPGITEFLDGAYGYAVYPTVGKGGFIVAGAYGDGEVFEGGRVIGISALSKGSIGLQVGGQIFEEIVFFKDKQAMDAFKSGTFAFDAGVSAVIVEAAAAANTPYKSGVAVFVRSKVGAMAEASIGGQGMTFTAD